MIHLDVHYPRTFPDGAGELALNLTLSSGSLNVVMGPSGAGKTTLLRLLAGLDTPKTGTLHVDTVPWLDTKQRINLAPKNRSVGYVFQDAALFPNLTVEENIAFGSVSRNLAQELLKTTGLTGLAKQKPSCLSGGQRQRVALARALARQPKILLLDEPFASLDHAAARVLRQLVRTLHTAWETTTVLVSHQLEDQHQLADRVLRIERGRLITDSQSADEIIEAIFFEQGQWVVRTNRSELRSTNPVWAHFKVNDKFPLISYH
ncbi:MAG: ATP-binding cassette domain-containing protein [Siphonobacter sp.]